MKPSKNNDATYAARPFNVVVIYPVKFLHHARINHKQIEHGSSVL